MLGFDLTQGINTQDFDVFVGIDVAYAEDGNTSFYFQVGDWLAN